MKIIEKQCFDEERALYGAKNIVVKECTFSGPQDGESFLKECANVKVENSYCNLRYPFWHDHILTITGSNLTENCRAALWYSDHIYIDDTVLGGIKALRECNDISIKNCDIKSPEFGWFVHNLDIENSKAEGEYFLMQSDNIRIKNLDFKGKYSFQYVENMTIENSSLDTKDAFWHSVNTTVINSTLKGEYLAWYSDGLTLINCTIIGTQPFCYCKNLTLINCQMIDTDLAFEKSEVNATITTSVVSIKNPLSGTIEVPSVGEIILDDESAKGKIIVK